MELMAIIILILISLIMMTIADILYRVHIKKSKTMRESKNDLVVFLLYLTVVVIILVVLPFDSYITDVNKNSVVITTREIIIRNFVVDGKDTLILYTNSKIDTLSVGILGILPDSLNLQTETVHTIFGEIFSKKIVE